MKKIILFLALLFLPIVSEAATFGYTSVGGSNISYSTGTLNGSFGIGAVANLNSISAYTYSSSSGKYMKGIMVLASNKTIISNGTGDAIAIPYQSSNVAWITSNFSLSPTISNVNYYPSNISDGTIYIYYDNTSSGTYWFQDTSNSYSSPSNPTDGTPYESLSPSIYATYQASASSRRMIITE